MVTKISVIKSGGVMMAATNIMTKKECFRYFDNNSDDTKPNLPRKKAITGSWNTSPMTNVSETNVEIYESSVMLLTTFADTL